MAVGVTLPAVATAMRDAAAAGFAVLVYGAGRAVQWWRSGSKESSISGQPEAAAPTTPFARANKGDSVVHSGPKSIL